MLDFMLRQSETEQQIEDDVFRGFSNEEYEGGGDACLKIINTHNGSLILHVIKFNFSFLFRKCKLKDISDR